MSYVESLLFCIVIFFLLHEKKKRYTEYSVVDKTKYLQNFCNSYIYEAEYINSMSVYTYLAKLSIQLWMCYELEVCLCILWDFQVSLRLKWVHLLRALFSGYQDLQVDPRLLNHTT